MGISGHHALVQLVKCGSDPILARRRTPRNPASVLSAVPRPSARKIHDGRTPSFCAVNTCTGPVFVRTGGGTERSETSGQRTSRRGRRRRGAKWSAADGTHEVRRFMAGTPDSLRAMGGGPASQAREASPPPMARSLSLAPRSANLAAVVHATPTFA